MVISLTLRSPTHPQNAPLERSAWHRKPRNKAETKADTTRCTKVFGAFLHFCRFHKFRYFIKLRLLKTARSTET